MSSSDDDNIPPEQGYPTASEVGTIRRAMATLQLDATCTKAQFKSSYMKALLRHHPDKGGDLEVTQYLNAGRELIDRYWTLLPELLKEDTSSSSAEDEDDPPPADKSDDGSDQEDGGEVGGEDEPPKKSKSVPLKCQRCRKVLKSKNAYKMHMRDHRNRNRFRCEECNRKFTRKFTLLRHVKTHHTDEKKPFPCRICRKRFLQASDLRRHQVTHTGGRPFQCSRCNAKFTTGSNLTRHKANSCR